MSLVRLDKLLANLGYGSRKDVQSMVRDGRIELDGAVVAAADRKLAPEAAAHLVIDDAPIDPLPGLVLMLNKPLGVTCSHKEAGPLVYGLLPDRWRRREPAMSTVGRLDKETSGLLLMTDDGVLLHKIIAPKAKVAKRYRASLARPLRDDAAAIFAAGTLMLEGEDRPLEPATLDRVSATDVRLTISEGRYHQVRRMFAAIGNHVIALHREAIGGLALPAELAPGAYTALDAVQVARVFAQP